MIPRLSQLVGLDQATPGAATAPASGGIPRLSSLLGLEQPLEQRLADQAKARFPGADVGTGGFDASELASLRAGRVANEARPLPTPQQALSAQGVDPALATADLGPDIWLARQQTEAWKEMAGRTNMEAISKRAVEATPAMQVPVVGPLAMGFLGTGPSRLASLGARAVGNEGLARDLYAANQGAASGLPQGRFNQAALSAGESLPAAILGGPGGATGIISLFTAQGFNDALDQGRQAGLEGTELRNFALREGGIEGTVAGVFQAAGLGGLETWKAPAKAGLREALKHLGITALQEVPEEIITELTHALNQTLSGVDPSDPNEDPLTTVYNTVLNTTLSTLMTAGAAEAIPKGRARTKTPLMPETVKAAADAEIARLKGSGVEMTPEKQTQIYQMAMQEAAAKQASVEGVTPAETNVSAAPQPDNASTLSGDLGKVKTEFTPGSKAVAGTDIGPASKGEEVTVVSRNGDYVFVRTKDGAVFAAEGKNLYEPAAAPTMSQETPAAGGQPMAAQTAATPAQPASPPQQASNPSVDKARSMGAKIDTVVEATNDEEKAAAEFAQQRGLNVVFVNSTNMEGFFDPESKTVLVRSGGNAPMAVVAHEVAHATGLDNLDLPSRSLLSRYRDKALQAAKAISPEYVAALEGDQERLNREAVAALVSDMANDPTIRRRLLKQKPSLVQRVADLVRDALRALSGKSEVAKRILAEFDTGVAAPSGMPAMRNQGDAIAKKLGVTFNGVQESSTGREPMYVFTDPQTGSTFYIKQSGGAELASQRLGEMRQKFAAAETPKPEPAAPAAEAPQSSAEFAEQQYDLARTDKKTQAPNELAFEEAAKARFAEADAEGKSTAVISTDLDGFKVVNEVLGHEVGDELLRAEKQAFEEALRADKPDRKGDYARLQGDEYVAIIRNVSDPEAAKKILARVQARFDELAKILVGDKLPPEAMPSISVGVAIREPGSKTDLTGLLQAAEKGPHGYQEAKAAGKKAKGLPEGRTELAAYIKRRMAEIEGEIPTAPQKTQEVVKPSGGPSGTAPSEAEAIFTNSINQTLTLPQKAKINKIRSDPGHHAEMLASARQGDENAKLMLMSAQVGRIASYARKLAGGNKSVAVDDLVSEGVRAMQQWMGGKTRRSKGESQEQFAARGGADTSALQRFEGANIWTGENGMAGPVRSAMQKAAFPARVEEEGKQVQRPRPEKSLPGLAEKSGVGEAQVAGPSRQPSPETQAELNDVMRLVQEMRVQGEDVDAIASRLARISGGDPAAIKEALGGFFMPAGSPDFDEKEVRDRLRKALAESPKKTGRPHLANVSDKEEARRLVDVVDQLRKEAKEPARLSDVETGKKAAAILANQAAKADLVQKLSAGEQLNNEETVAGKEIVSTEAFAAATSSSGDVAKAVKLIDGWRRGGTAQARAFRNRADKHKSPQKRLAEFVAQALLQPPPAAKGRIDEQAKVVADPGASTAQVDAAQAKIDHELAEWAKRYQDLKENLRKSGFDLDKLTEKDLKNKQYVLHLLREIQIQKAEAGDMLYEWWINSLLSFPPTNVANITGNTIGVLNEFLLQRPLEAATNELTGRKIPGAPTLVESRSVRRGIASAIARAARNFALSWSTESDVFESDLLGPEAATNKLELSRAAAMPGFFGRLVRSGFYLGGGGRLLKAVDEFYKTLVGHIEVYAQADRAGRRQGLSGAKLDAYVDEQVADTASDAWMAALDEARRLTFNKELGKIGQKGLDLRRAWHERMKSDVFAPRRGMRGKVATAGNLAASIARAPLDLQYHIPFVNTLVNLMKWGVKRSPLGTPKFLFDLAHKGLSGVIRTPNAPAGKALLRSSVEQALGYVLLAAVAWSRDDEDDLPLLTGSSPYTPSNRAARETAYRTMPPMHMRIPGTSLAFSYERLDPVATVLAGAVDMLDTMRDVKKGKQVGDAVGDYYARLVEQVKSRTFAEGIARAVDMLQDDKTTVSWMRDFAVSFMPNLIRGTARSFDQKIRETRTPSASFEEFAKRQIRTMKYQLLPLPSNAPPPKIDVWGNEVAAEGTVVEKILSPIKRRSLTVYRGDRLLLKWNKEHPDERWNPDQMQPEFRLKDQNGKEFKVVATPAQYAVMARLAGATARAMLEQSTVNADNPGREDLEVLKAIIRASREYARAMMVQGGEIKPKE
ncbi:MAG: GGDEF domain-containing protein [Phycisphaeraceae bacterium]|nr:GGDEF domain-containing protein [Phycisphaeraceae bacterium]